MLTMVLLMRALDPLMHEKETDLYLEKLTQVDCYRQGYYRDLGKYTQHSVTVDLLLWFCLTLCLRV